MSRRHSIRLPDRQRGQALIFAMFLLTIGCLGLYMLFSAGQVTTDKARVTNAADAAAYSGAVWRARVLNYEAYSNRAIVANELAIAQYLTLSNWVRYIATATGNINDITQFIPYVGEVTGEIADAADEAKAITDEETDVAVPARDVYKTALAASQEIMNLSTQPVPGLGVSGGMYLVSNQVVHANDPSFSTVLIVSSDDFNGFTTQYQDDDRMRLAQVVLASRDGFTANRPWDLGQQSCWATLGSFLPPVNGEIMKRGGTSLTTLDRWDSVDTLSVHWISLSFNWLDEPSCNPNEMPIGWGGTVSPQEDNGDFASSDIESGDFGGSRATNPSAHGYADDDHSDIGNFGGIAVVRELSSTQLSATNPTSRFALMVATAPNSTRTSDQIQMGADDMRLNKNGQTPLLKGSIAAVSAAEVYFQRATDISSMARADGKVELASLYNPYWQARLVTPTDQEHVIAYGMIQSGF